ncbi:endonuclease domain-containing 1 protein-like [Erythrolamprus reginae]|uniref:endonuclease domain-containing 1 protein-like n=1 Tax=Erythrolamprus reginae TaxID=121349 RepID=UPI00396CB114
MLPLWTLSLAASFLLPATGEVVTNFKTCTQFFFYQKPPKLSLSSKNLATICQHYKGKYRFATMYDRERRIPIFSAYKYQPGGRGRSKNWMIEPQLALPRERTRKSMESEKNCKIDRELLRNSQALNEDYKQTTTGIYNRGHLLPVSHQKNRESRAATSTLTNIVPQFQRLNQGKWAGYEINMKKNTTGCLDTYVLVGVVPGDKFIADGRVNIPSHMWAAACCETKEKQRKSWGVIAKNNENRIVYHKLQELEKELAKCYGGVKINLFNGDCYSAKQLHITNTSAVQT